MSSFFAAALALRELCVMEGISRIEKVRFIASISGQRKRKENDIITQEFLCEIQKRDRREIVRENFAKTSQETRKRIKLTTEQNEKSDSSRFSSLVMTVSHGE